MPFSSEEQDWSKLSSRRDRKQLELTGISLILFHRSTSRSECKESYASQFSFDYFFNLKKLHGRHFNSKNEIDEAIKEYYSKK